VELLRDLGVNEGETFPYKTMERQRLFQRKRIGREFLIENHSAFILVCPSNFPFSRREFLVRILAVSGMEFGAWNPV
jgi:hypothetical protein